MTSLTVKFPLLDPDGEAYAACGIATDISALKRAEEEWRKFAFLADHSYDFIGICDMQLAPGYLNREGMKLVGIDSLEELHGLPITEFFFPEDRPFITEDFFPRVLREGHGEVEIRFRNLRTGDPIWMLYSVVLLRNEAGEPTGLATISRDITERLRGEEAVRRRSEQLRKLADVASRINAARDMTSVLAARDRGGQDAARGPSIGRRPHRQPELGECPLRGLILGGIRRSRTSPGAAGGPRSLPGAPVVPDSDPPDPGGARGGARPGHPSRGRRSPAAATRPARRPPLRPRRASDRGDPAFGSHRG